MYHTLSSVLWAQVFFLQSNERSVRLEPVDLSRLAETLSSALCIALSPKLPQLAEAGLHQLALRARIDNENVRSCLLLLYDVVTVFLLFIFMQKVATMIPKSKALLYVF